LFCLLFHYFLNGFSIAFAQSNPRQFGIRMGLGALRIAEQPSFSILRLYHPTGNLTGLYSHEWEVSGIGFQVELGMKGSYILLKPEYNPSGANYFFGQTELGTYLKLRLNNGKANYYLHVGPKIESLALQIGSVNISSKDGDSFEVLTQFSDKWYNPLEDYTFFWGGHLSFWRELPNLSSDALQLSVGVGVEHTRPANRTQWVPFSEGITYPFMSLAFGF
jgi:hypothetical protein